MPRLPLIGVTVCNTRSGLNTSCAAALERLRTESLAVGLATMTRALPHVRRHRHLLTTLPFIEDAITTGVALMAVCRGFLSTEKLLCYTSSAFGPALESGASRRVNVELSYQG